MKLFVALGMTGLLAACSSTSPVITGQPAIRHEQYQAAYTTCLRENVATNTEEFGYCLRRHGVYYVPQPSSGMAAPVTVYSSTPVYASSPIYSAPVSSPASKPSYRRYIRGPRGGCYYINGNGNKTYVARSMCS